MTPSRPIMISDLEFVHPKSARNLACKLAYTTTKDLDPNTLSSKSPRCLLPLNTHLGTDAARPVLSARSLLQALLAPEDTSLRLLLTPAQSKTSPDGRNQKRLDRKRL